MKKQHQVHPLTFLVRACQPDLARRTLRSLMAVHFHSSLRESLLLLTGLGYQFRLRSGSALRLFRYLLGRDHTISGTFREGRGCDSPSRAGSTYQLTFQVARRVRFGDYSPPLP